MPDKGGLGKSYMLLQIIDIIKRSNGNPNIIYINKELNEFDELRDYKDLYKFIEINSIKNGKNYIFIDEIQDIYGFEKTLRSLKASGGYDIYCTGSNSNLLSGELSTYLSGRYIQIEVYSLSYTEFLGFHRLEDSQESLFKYIKYGGLPYLMHLKKDDSIIFDYLNNVYNTILYKDIFKSTRSGMLPSLKDWLDFLRKIQRIFYRQKK